MHTRWPPGIFPYTGKSWSRVLSPVYRAPLRAAVLGENFPVHETSMTSFQPPFGLQSPEKEDARYSAKTTIAEHWIHRFWRDWNEKRDGGKKGRLKKKEHCLELTVGSAPRSDGAKRRTAGPWKKTRGAVDAGMKREEGEDRWSEGTERKGKQAWKSREGRVWRYKKDGWEEIGCLVLIAWAKSIVAD